VTPFILALIAAVLLGLALSVLRARPRSPINRWFAAYTTAMAGWTGALACLHFGFDAERSARAVFASASFIPGAFLAFTRVYPTPSPWPPIMVTRLGLTIGAIFAGLSLFTPLLVYDAVLTPQGFSRKSGPLYPLFAAYFLMAWISALGVFIAKWRRARGHERAQLQYLGIGLIVSGAGGITSNLLVPLFLGIATYVWLGPFFILPLVALVGHAIIRHRLLDLRPVIHRGVAHGAVTGLVAAVALTIVRLLPATSNQTISVQLELSVVALVVLLMASAPAQRVFARVLDPYLYRGALDHGSALSHSTRRLSRLMQPDQVASELQSILTAAFVPESYVMVARSGPGGEFRRLSATDDRLEDLLLHSPEVQRLAERQPCPSVICTSIPVDDPVTATTYAKLRDAGLEIVLVLGRRDEILGLVGLGPRRSGDAYFERDLALLETLADLASIAIQNALLYSQRVQMLEYSERLLESLDAAVVAVDVQARITSFNRAAGRLLGLNDADRGAPLTVLPSEIAWALTFALTDVWRARELEATVEHPARGVVPVMVSTAVLRDDQRRIAGALVVVTDLSAIKELERNQRRVERLATMARFYTGIAHEIRSPLASISNFISMLPDRFDDPEYRDTATRLLPLEVSRIARLADRLRLMAPSEGAKLTTVDLGGLLADIVAIHAASAKAQGVEIVLKRPARVPRIRGDQGQLIQLFVNLLNNAIEAMPDGGVVEIELGHRQGPTGAAVIVRIVDEGVGIDPGIRQHLFQPFFTTKVSGTGLGLSICREIADFHRADLRLIPRPGVKGTIAEIEFPIREEEIVSLKPDLPLTRSLAPPGD